MDLNSLTSNTMQIWIAHFFGVHNSGLKYLRLFYIGNLWKIVNKIFKRLKLIKIENKIWIAHSLNTLLEAFKIFQPQLYFREQY